MSIRVVCNGRATSIGWLHDASSAYGSPSYYAQCMFANHVGNKVVPVSKAKVSSTHLQKDQLPPALL